MIVRTYQSEVRRNRDAAPVPGVERPERVQRRWDSDSIATLDRYLTQPLTFGQIARKMNRTRNSIIGFDWRRRNR